MYEEGVATTTGAASNDTHTITTPETAYFPSDEKADASGEQRGSLPVTTVIYIITGFVIVAVVALAALLGRRTNKPPQSMEIPMSTLQQKSVHPPAGTKHVVNPFNRSKDLSYV